MISVTLIPKFNRTHYINHIAVAMHRYCRSHRQKNKQTFTSNTIWGLAESYDVDSLSGKTELRTHPCYHLIDWDDQMIQKITT